MTYTVLILTARKAGMSFSEFKSHYENHHVPLLYSIFGKELEPVSHTRNYTDRTTTNGDTIWMTGSASEFQYDCVTVATWKDQSTFSELGKVLANPEHRQKIVEDEERFIDRSKTQTIAVGASPSTVKSA